MKRFRTLKLLGSLALLLTLTSGLHAQNGRIRINVLLNTNVTGAILADLGRYGDVTDVITELNAATVRAPERLLSTIAALPLSRPRILTRSGRDRQLTRCRPQTSSTASTCGISTRST